MNIKKVKVIIQVQKIDSQRQNAYGFAFRILNYANFDMIFNNSKFDLC